MYYLIRRILAKIFGLVGALLAFVGGLVIGLTALAGSFFGFAALASGSGLSTIGVLSNLSAAALVVVRLAEAFLGLLAVISAIMMYAGSLKLGGYLATFVGVIFVFLTSFSVMATFVLAAGIIGIIGGFIKPVWWKFWKM